MKVTDYWFRCSSSLIVFAMLGCFAGCSPPERSPQLTTAKAHPVDEWSANGIYFEDAWLRPGMSLDKVKEMLGTDDERFECGSKRVCYVWLKDAARFTVEVDEIGAVREVTASTDKDSNLDGRPIVVFEGTVVPLGITRLGVLRERFTHATVEPLDGEGFCLWSMNVEGGPEGSEHASFTATDDCELKSDKELDSLVTESASLTYVSERYLSSAVPKIQMLEPVSVDQLEDNFDYRLGLTPDEILALGWEEWERQFNRVVPQFGFTRGADKSVYLACLREKTQKLKQQIPPDRLEKLSLVVASLKVLSSRVGECQWYLIGGGNGFDPQEDSWSFVSAEEAVTRAFAFSRQKDDAVALEKSKQQLTKVLARLEESALAESGVLEDDSIRGSETPRQHVGSLVSMVRETSNYINNIIAQESGDVQKSILRAQVAIVEESI
jgi:hypothetical protein